MSIQTNEEGFEITKDLVDLGYFASDSQESAMDTQDCYHKFADKLPHVRIDLVQDLKLAAQSAAMSYSLLARACEGVLEDAK